MEQIFYFMLSLSAPYYVEHYLQVSQNIGNMALHGIFLDIYNKRNLFYFSLTLLFIEYINNHTTYCLLLVLLSFIAFINCCNKWRTVIFYNMKK